MIEILIVEDNESFRDMMRGTLQADFPLAVVSTASEGVSALRKVNRKKPDLIFTDIRMPGKNGLELTREIKQLYPDIDVIILTNMDTTEYRRVASENGADSFLSKESMRAEDVHELVERTIARCRSRH